mmetsp:Transcript_41287/g.93374  ORF Transcript_41287/g.93374 Transcript_41287/m.93374 type:complete len:210 (+) Transcript_41287:449-1078(+)
MRMVMGLIRRSFPAAPHRQSQRSPSTSPSWLWGPPGPGCPGRARRPSHKTWCFQWGWTPPLPATGRWRTTGYRCCAGRLLRRAISQWPTSSSLPAMISKITSTWSMACRLTGRISSGSRRGLWGSKPMTSGPSGRKLLSSSPPVGMGSPNPILRKPATTITPTTLMGVGPTARSRGGTSARTTCLRCGGIHSATWLWCRMCWGRCLWRW